MTTPNVETLNYLRAALSNGQTWAVVTQNADGTLAISVDIGPGVANETIEPLEGPPGPAGTSQFPLMPMPDVYDSPADLPTAMTNTLADIGKFWLIDLRDESGGVTSTGAYIWFGTQYRFLPFGPQGPPGIYPMISPYVNLIGPDRTSGIEAPGDGSATDPYLLTVELSVPEGPPGRCCPLAQMPDVDEAVPPTVGELMAYNGQTIDYEGHTLPLWQPTFTGDIVPQPYIVPAAAFTSQFGIEFGGEVVTIATFSVPPKGFPWKPLVFGQIRMWELELSLQPLLMGIEVRLGAPNGTLVARGFGNDLGGVVNIVPHTSSPDSPDTAMTPWNDVGMVPANHTGAQGTLFANVVNDGIIAIYDYNASSAALFVLACPATAEDQLRRSIVGALTTKVTLSAEFVSKGS
jgi:hypothetical protein